MNGLLAFLIVSEVAESAAVRIGLLAPCSEEQEDRVDPIVVDDEVRDRHVVAPLPRLRLPGKDTIIGDRLVELEVALPLPEGDEEDVRPRSLGYLNDAVETPRASLRGERREGRDTL